MDNITHRFIGANKWADLSHYSCGAIRKFQEENKMVRGDN